MTLLLLIIIISRRRRRADGINKHNNVVTLSLMQFNVVVIYKYLDLFSFFFLFSRFLIINLMNVYFDFEITILKC